MIDADRDKLIAHIRERLDKSTLDSPTIALTKEAWALILMMLEETHRLADAADTLKREFDRWRA